MTYALFCDKCKLGSFCNEKIEPFICDSCNQPERLSPEDHIVGDNEMISDSLNQANT